MMRIAFFCVGFAAVASSTAQAADARQASAATRATFSITGLHCPPCSRTVESSLRKLEGVRSAKVDYATKSAKIDFDEQRVSAQQIAEAIAATPHMMGAGMHYGSWLSLSVPGLKDEASAASVRAALAKLPGVAQVSPFTGQHAISVQFTSEGKATIGELIGALAKVGLEAKTY